MPFTKIFLKEISIYIWYFEQKETNTVFEELLAPASIQSPKNLLHPWVLNYLFVERLPVALLFPIWIRTVVAEGVGPLKWWR